MPGWRAPGLPVAGRAHPAERHTRREGADHGSETQKHRRAARCGAELPSITSVHDQPPGPKRIECDLLSLADEYAPGRFARHDG